MQLIYLDESGNTGVNLGDSQQPVFVLCALIVAEDKWQSLETDLCKVLDAKIPNWKTQERFEVHASELRRGTGFFAKMTVKDRIALRDEWMKVGVKHEVRLMARSIKKKLYGNWLSKTFGQGIIVHPYVAAFALLSRCVDNHLAMLSNATLGILIFDENQEIVGDIEKSIRVFREITSPLRLGRIIEKGFFIESHKSLPLQLCDLFALSIRKSIEAGLSHTPPKSFDESGVKLANSIRLDDHQHDGDVLAWLIKQHSPTTPSAKK